jgi:Cu2+-containing amine oxidase
MLAKNLPSYVIPAEDVMDEDIVVWYTGSIHHVERDEDDGPPSDRLDGITQLMKVGFTLSPHDLFDASPLSRPE